MAEFLKTFLFIQLLGLVKISKAGRKYSPIGILTRFAAVLLFKRVKSRFIDKIMHFGDPALSLLKQVPCRFVR